MTPEESKSLKIGQRIAFLCTHPFPLGTVEIVNWNSVVVRWDDGNPETGSIHHNDADTLAFACPKCGHAPIASNVTNHACETSKFIREKYM